MASGGAATPEHAEHVLGQVRGLQGAVERMGRLKPGDPNMQRGQDVLATAAQSIETAAAGRAGAAAPREGSAAPERQVPASPAV